MLVHTQPLKGSKSVPAFIVAAINFVLLDNEKVQPLVLDHRGCYLRGPAAEAIVTVNPQRSTALGVLCLYYAPELLRYDSNHVLKPQESSYKSVPSARGRFKPRGYNPK